MNRSYGISPALHHLASRFPLLKLRVTLAFQHDTVLPAFKGSMLHGWFGHALKRSDEQAFHICYGEHDQQQPKPYIICPNNDHKTHWHKGELYDFDLTLFGSAIRLQDAIVTALTLGEKMGLGDQRTPFEIISIASCTAAGLKPGLIPSTLSDYMAQSDFDPFFEGNMELAIQMITPVRLKYRGEIVKRHAPGLGAWCNHILRRLSQLSRFWVIDDDELLDAIFNERPPLREQEMTSHCYYEDWQRFSLKQKAQLPFGGLKGQVSFYGEINHAIPLLKIGEQLHLGGKTTFGLGKYQLTG
ncbi:MAG: hypothetical protein CSB48_13870 [Proteobacteria bacterium]|nr:MAG: hypothetical protein CSB48_13870 [Pseudomonadota bacterium]